MSTQDILRIVGIALLVVAVVFTVLAVHYFITNRIKEVMDDLSGKARAKGVAGAQKRTASQAKKKAAAQSESSGQKKPAVTAGSVVEAPAAPAELAFAAFDDEDDAGTVVVDADFDAAPKVTTTDTTDKAAAWTGALAFRVIGSIVLCDSNQIIAAGEGM